MPATKRTLDELNKLGDEIYSRQVQPSLKPEDHGKFVAIDVDSGEFELDDDDYAAISRLLQKTGSGHVVDEGGLSSGVSDWGNPIMKGVVNARNEAMVTLHLRGPGGVESDIDGIVDSGFTSSLTLPSAVSSALGLIRQTGSSAVLADGTVRQFDIYEAEVLWDGAWRMVAVSAVGNETLIGMRLLAGHKLVIDVVPGGLVEIAPLP